MQLVDTVTKFFHHLFNPHCDHCREERERELEIRKEDESCNNCKVLRELLENERTEKRMLLEKLLPKEKVVEQQVNDSVAVNRFRAPSAVLRQMEVKSRIEATELLRNKQVSKEVEELEKELGVGDNHLGAVEH